MPTLPLRTVLGDDQQRQLIGSAQVDIAVGTKTNGTAIALTNFPQVDQLREG